LAPWASTETCNAEPATRTLRQTGGGTLLKRTCAVAAAGVAALGLAFGLAPQRDIATEIAIAAPPARVWAILTDTDA
jgi:carbon monoxide dehydrogenase subunit G